MQRSFNGVGDAALEIDVGVSAEALDALQHQVPAQVPGVEAGEGNPIPVPGEGGNLGIVGLNRFLLTFFGIFQKFIF